MRRRQPLPRTWFMTDDRRGPDPVAVARKLPKGAGIVFRHYGLSRAERRRLFRQLRSVATARGLVLMLAGDPALARAWGADGSHGLAKGKVSATRMLRSVPVHDRKELVSARRYKADFVFVSPVFATRSHPGARSLGAVRFGQVAGIAAMPVIALGGMSTAKMRRMAALGAYGWAGIDAFA